MGRLMTWLAPVLVIGNVGPLAAQLERAASPKPTVVPAVASLAVESSRNGVWLRWPPAAGAPEYWVERADNTGGAPVTVSRGPTGTFAFDGNNCSMRGAPLNQCVYFDPRLTKNVLYSYRVWTGGGPSPVGARESQLHLEARAAESALRSVSKKEYELIWACF